MKKIRNLFIGVLAASMILSPTAGSLARAQSTADMQAQIAALLAQVQALTAQLNAGTSASITFTRNLTVGSTGADVLALQKFLNANGCTVSLTGAGSVGMESSYFGAKTKAAVACWQAAKGISPAVGYFGPVTRAAVNAMVVVTPTTPTTPGTPGLSGGAGSVDQYSLMSEFNNEEVGEGQNDIEVAGLEIEVDSGSDIRLSSVRLVFDEGTADRRFNRYADEVSLWLDGDEVARVDASEFTSNNNWTRSISLDSGAIIRRGQSGELIVAVSAVNNIDSADEGETWTVDFRQIRFVDAQGASISEDPMTDVRVFSFESFASVSNVELRLRLNSDDDHINEARVLNVDDADRTENLEVLSFTLEARGNSDLTIDEIPVLLSTTEAAGADFSDPNEVIIEASLWMNGERVSRKSLPSSDAADHSDIVVFDDLDIEIDAGDTAEFIVKVTMISTAGVLDNGDTVRAQITATQRSAMDVEDEQGNDVDSRNGIASADAHVVYDAGIQVELVSVSETRSFTAKDPGQADRGEFRITFRATSFGGDMRLDRSCEDVVVDGQGDAGEGAVFSVSDASATVITCGLSASGTDGEDNSFVYEIDENTTRTFTLTVVVEGDSDFVSVQLESLNWGIAQDNTNANFYTFNLGQFKTGPLFLNTI